MITTWRKTRLPKRLCYAAGAKAVSEALSGVPQYEELQLYFTEGTRAQKGGMTGEPYPVFYVTYSPGLRPWQPSTQPPWLVWVWAVPVELKPRIAAKLDEEGFAAARRWLVSHGDMGNRRNEHSLDIYFDAARDCLVCDTSVHPVS